MNSLTSDQPELSSRRKVRWQPNRRSVGSFVGDALDELEELRRMHDRIRDRRVLDQLLLGAFGPEVAALLQPLGPHHRQCDVMANLCFRFGSKQIAGGGLKDLQYGGVLEGRRVRHIDHHSRIGQSVSQALAGEGVDAGVR